eukprot:scaffold249308_cov70-Cyclotella_meneghiniana.AAC.9
MSTSTSERTQEKSHPYRDEDVTIGTISLSSQSVSSSGRHIRRFRRSARGSRSNSAVRKRYLYRLGINEHQVYRPDVQTDLDSITTSCSRDSSEAMLKPPPLSQSSESSKSSLRTRHSGHGDSERVLLRKSAQYTTELKFNKSDPTDVEQAHRSCLTSRSLSPLDGLSAAWTSHLLAIGETDAHHHDSNAEPLDGAFDLFSLPSDSSILSGKRGIKTAESNDSFTEASSVSNTTASFSFNSLHREINEIRRHRKVSFDAKVKEATIPNRHSYSQRIRTKLWSSSEDIAHNAMRNEFEFSFDGRDWRNSREESDFISIAPSSDEKIHPAHFYGWPYASKSVLFNEESSLEKKGSSSSDDEGGDIHFCGVFGMEMND